MRRIVLALSLAASLLVVAPFSFGEGGDDLLLDRFRAYIDALRVQGAIPGVAAAIAGRNDIVWEHASGLQDTGRNIAVRPDTPFHIDGLTQILTASMILRCVEDAAFSLDDPMTAFKRNPPEPEATIRQLLTHTSSNADGLSFAYRLERLEQLTEPVSDCARVPYARAVAQLLDRFAMIDSVPGPDALRAAWATDSDRALYAAALARAATPYAVDKKGRAVPSTHPATTLTASGGMMSTVRDLARFDIALRKGALVRDDTLAAAWRPPLGRDLLPLPHGMGWFVQTYNGEPVVWQFGMTENASSSLMITLPARGMTLIVLANSDGLAKPYPLSAGDVAVSPFARVFLAIFTRS